MSNVTLLCLAVLALYLGVVLFVFLKIIANSVSVKASERVMKHRPIVGWFALFGGVIMFVGGVAILYFEQSNLDGDALFGGIGCTLIGFVISTGMMPSMSSSNFVIWTDNYVEGPNKKFGLTLSLSRKRCSWKDVIKTGLTFTGYNYFETKTGDKIYWSSYSQNVPEFYQKLGEALEINDAH